MKCVKCKNIINPLRMKALPNTKVCVDCSTAGAYKAVTTTEGSGDHTWNDIQILTPDQFDSYQQAEDKIREMKNLPKSSGLEEEIETPLKNKKK